MLSRCYIHKVWKCENGEQKPQNLPFPLHDVDPCNIAMHGPTARTTTNGSSDGWGTVAHVCREVAFGYNDAPQICPQKYPFPWTDPQTPLPALSLDTSDLWCQMASGSDMPFFHNALDRQTDRSFTESLMTIARFASNESDAA